MGGAGKVWVAVGVCLLIGASAVKGASPDQVGQAIEKAKAYLYERQSDGHWETSPAPNPRSAAWMRSGGQWGGQTALATYALLAAGESPADERLARSIEFLKSAEMQGTYALAMRCMVWLHLPQTDEIRALMRKDAEALLARVKTEDEARGQFDYLPSGAGGAYSHSRTQFAALGLWAAAQAGVNVPRAFWEQVEAAFIRHQHQSGGWTYTVRSEHPLTAGMTAAAVATLFITNDFLRADVGANLRGNVANPPIEAGLRWIAEHFDRVATDERYPRDYPFVTLYSIERIGVASGLKYFHGEDWYRKGAEWLLRVQRRNGSWSSADGQIGPIADTSFGILFLVYGRAPVVMNKLQYSLEDSRGREMEGRWNQRPRDAANITRWIGRQLERNLNWQIAALDRPVEELHDAPILYISGDQVLNFSEADERKLKLFIEQGGTILGNADGGRTQFAGSLRRLGMKLFPQYEFRELPADHPIYTDQQFNRARWRSRPNVLAMSNGVRELIILIPQGDAARAWQADDHARRPEVFQLAANIFLYAVDKQNLRYKGQTHIILPDEAIKPQRTIRVARLKYDGNWDPEPGGWRRLAAVMHNEHQVALEIEKVPLGEGALVGHAIAHLTGTGSSALDEAARGALQRFVENGGTLIVDAAGGSAEFAEAAEHALQAIFGEQADRLAEALPAHHSLYTAGATPLPEIGYRDFMRRNVVGQLDAPRLRAIELAGRPAVIFSREDLSAGLVGQPVDGILGYDPPTATALTVRIILYAAEGSAD